MASESRTRASLVVLSATATSAELAERIGWAGDQQWNAGDRVRPSGRTVQKFNGWEVSSRADRSSPPQEHLRDLVERIRPIAPAIRALSERPGNDVRVQVWLHLDSPQAGVSFSAEDLNLLAELGSLEIDIYS